MIVTCMVVGWSAGVEGVTSWFFSFELPSVFEASELAVFSVSLCSGTGVSWAKLVSLLRPFVQPRGGQKDQGNA